MKRKSRFKLAILSSFALFLINLLAPLAPVASAAPTRSLIDRVDDSKGAQLHLVYLVASDAQDKNWDTSGQIKTWLDAAQTWLFSEVGKRLRIDTYNGDYDITFLRSKITLADMQARSKSYGASGTPLLPELMSELINQSPQLNYVDAPKTYMFISSDRLATDSCGYAYNFSVTGIAFVGPGCWSGPQDDNSYPYGMPYPAATIIHEAIHTYGVEHTCDNSSNLMLGSPQCANSRTYGRMSLDPARASYYGGEKAGADISKLLIWSDGSGDPNYGKVTATKTFTWRIGGEASLSIGKEDQSITWQWSKIGLVRAGTYFGCTLTAAEGTITAKIIDSKCVFDIPLTWRGGQVGQVTGKVIIGPYFGDTTESIKIFNPDNRYEVCGEKYCFAGQKVSISSNYCYASSKMSFELQQYVGGQWKVISEVPAEVAEGCGPDKYRPQPVSITYQENENFIYRWSQISAPNFSSFDEPIKAISILPANAEYPSSTKLNELNQAIELEKSAAQVAAEVFNTARKLLRNQLIQCSEGKACYANQMYKSNDLCFSGSIDQFQLEQLIDKKWVVVFTGAGTKDDPACSTGTTRTPRHEMSFNAPGLQITRWVTITSGRNSYGSPYGIVVKELKDGLITDAEIGAAQTEAKSIIKAIEDANKPPVNPTKTITCVKGKSTKKVTSVNPTCPKGYKKK